MRLFTKRSQKTSNVVRASLSYLAIASCATFLFLPHFDVICDLLVNRRPGKWSLFVNCTLPYGTLSYYTILHFSILKQLLNQSVMCFTIPDHILYAILYHKYALYYRMEPAGAVTGQKPDQSIKHRKSAFYCFSPHYHITSRNVQNTRLRLVFPAFTSCSQMPVVFYPSVIHGLDC